MHMSSKKLKWAKRLAWFRQQKRDNRAKHLERQMHQMLEEIDAHPAVQRQLFMDNVYSYVLCDAVLKFK